MPGSNQNKNFEKVKVDIPRISAASRWRSGHIGAVNLKTDGDVSTTDRPCGWGKRRYTSMRVLG